MSDLRETPGLPNSQMVESEGSSTVALLIALGRFKALLVGLPLLGIAIAIGLSFVLPKWYTGAIRILPPQQGQSSAAAMLSQMGGLAGAAAGAVPGLKNPSDLYIGMLKSTTIADALVARFNLKQLYGTHYQVDTRKALAANSRFAADKSGIITIEADAKDPQVAADIANAYVEELHRLTSVLAVTDAAQRRVFFEGQLRQTNDKLAEAEANLREAMDAGGLVSVDAQGRGAMETVARLRAQISAKEIQIGAMRAYATPSNPDMLRAEQELASMRQELARLETGAPREPKAGDPAARKGKKDGGGLGSIRLLREVKYNEVMFELLAKQYEMARVDESKEAPIVQVMDRATPPEKKSRPRLRVLVPVGFLSTLLLAIAVSLTLHAMEVARQDPARAAQLEALRAAWSRRPR